MFFVFFKSECVLCAWASSNKRVSVTRFLTRIFFIRSLATIAEGVDYDTVAREWRCRWSPEEEKASLVAAQKAFEKCLDELKQVDGIIKVDRIVCGGCKDYKVWKEYIFLLECFGILLTNKHFTPNKQRLFLPCRQEQSTMHGQLPTLHQKNSFLKCWKIFQEFPRLIRKLTQSCQCTLEFYCS